jgi:hypothetical protein
MATLIAYGIVGVLVLVVLKMAKNSKNHFKSGYEAGYHDGYHDSLKDVVKAQQELVENDVFDIEINQYSVDENITFH